MLNTEKLCPGCMNDKGGEKICPVCGFEANTQNPKDCLPIGFSVDDRYLIGKVKSRNSESVIYIGWDKSEDKAVRIKEYFPKGFSTRNPDYTVSMVSGGEYTYNEGLIEFIDINRQIISSALPSLMPVKAVFEENGTAYAVSQNISYISMGDFLTKNGGSLKWEQVRPLFLPLIDTVRGMNELGIVHGGISTSTILVGRDGKLRISGYGIKKLRYSDNELEPELFSGFAAVEQYNSGETQLTPAADVYGLCALLFTVLIGNVPPNALERIKNDSMTIPAHFAEELPRHVLSALANGLQVLQQNRTGDIETLKNELVYAETTENSRTVKKQSASEKDNGKKKKQSSGTAKYVIISSVCTAVIFMAVVVLLVFTVFKKDFFGSTSSTDLSAQSSSQAPSVASIGSIDANAAESAVLFDVPNVVGKYYSEVTDSASEDFEKYEKFEFVIKDKVFNDKVERGQICAQSVAAGTGVARDTVIEVTISLGSKEIKIASVVGKDQNSAVIELLKQGFLYDNIEVLEKYDQDREAGIVIEQEPKYGTKVSTDTAVKIYVNTYSPSSDASSSSHR